MTTNYYYGSNHIFTSNKGSGPITLDAINANLIIDGIYSSDPNITGNADGITLANSVTITSTLNGTTVSTASAEFEDIYITNLNVSSTINASHANISNMTLVNYTASALSSPLISSTNSTITNLTTTNTTITNATITNSTITNITTSNLTATLINSTHTGTNTISGNLIVSGSLSYANIYGRYTAGSALSISAGKTNLNCFSSFSASSGGEITSGTGSSMVVNVSGYYLINYYINIASVVWSGGDYIYVNINFSERFGSKAITNTLIGTPTFFEGSCIVRLTAGETVSLGIKWFQNTNVEGRYFIISKLF